MLLPRKRDWALAIFLVVFPLFIQGGDWYYVVDDPIRGPWIKDRASWTERVLVSLVVAAAASGGVHLGKIG